MVASGRERISRREGIALALVFAGAVALRLGLLAHHGLNNNEYITVTAIQQGWGELISERMAMNHMPLYFLVMKAWTGVAGFGEAALRFPSAITGVLAVLLLWWVGRSLFGPSVGLAAAALGTFNQQWVIQSLDARMYIHLMTLTLAAVGCVWRWVETREGKWALLYLLTMALGLAIHLLIMCVMIALVAWWIFPLRRERGAPGWRFPALILFPLVFLLPLEIWWLAVQDKVGHESEWDIQSPMRVVRNCLRAAFGDYDPLGDELSGIFRILTIPLFVLSIGFAVAHRARRTWQGEPLGDRRRLGLALVAWVMIIPPVGIWAAATRSGEIIGLERYLSTATALFPILLAVAWIGCRPVWLRFAGLGLCLFATIFQVAVFLVNPGQGIREAISHLRAEAAPGHVVVSCGSNAMMYAFDYYDLGMPLTQVDREERDPDEIIDQVRGALGEDGERLFLFLYHPKRSPAPRLLRSQDQVPWLLHVETRRFGEVAILVFDRVE